MIILRVIFIYTVNFIVFFVQSKSYSSGMLVLYSKKYSIKVIDSIKRYFERFKDIVAAALKKIGLFDIAFLTN